MSTERVDEYEKPWWSTFLLSSSPCPPPHLRPHQAKASCGPVCMLLVKRTSINVSYSM